MSWAYFDSDGVCLLVSDFAFDPKDAPGVGPRIEVAPGARTSDLHRAGGKALPTRPTTLALPAVVEVGTTLALDLPQRTVADVNGQRQRGKLRLAPTEVGPLYVEVRGAEVGSFVVQARTYAEQRAAEYPSVAAQLEAVTKGLAGILGLPGGDPAPFQALWTEIQAVKARHPQG